METLTLDGRDTAYRETSFGDGPPVLYVHGSGSTHRLWVEQYAPGGPAPAVAIDLSGHGESDDVDTAAGDETLDAYADDVCAVAQETDAGVLAGNSMGGAVATWVVLERDLPVDGLVLCGTGAKLGVAADLLDALANDFEAALDALHGSGMFYHDVDEETLDGSRGMMRATGRRVTERDFRTCDAFDVRDRLDEIDVPCLAITGAEDGLTPPRFHEYLGEHVPDCEVEILEDAAHLSMQERAEAWNARVADFLDGL